MAARFKIGAGVVCLAAASCGFVAAGQEEPANPTAKVSINVVFPAGTQFIDTVKETCQDLRSEKLQDCFAREMKKAKATLAAVEFSKQLGEPGFVRDFKVAGPVDIAYVLYPYRANENQSWLVVNGEPAIIDVDNQKLIAGDNVKRNATYLALAKAHPQISLWPGDRNGTEYPDVEMGVNAGVHIIVNYRLREQCHACAVWGHAWYSFDFDSKGQFGGAKLIGVSIARDKAAVVRETNKSVAASVGEEVTIALPVKPAAGSEWMLAKGLDTAKVRLIEHSHVAPPSETGEAGTDELWKFAALGAGTTGIEFQKAAESGKAAKPVKFRMVVVREARAAGAAKARAKD
jgi:predicted secreted protein